MDIFLSNLWSPRTSHTASERERLFIIPKIRPSDANGYFNEFHYRGYRCMQQFRMRGPEISLYLNDEHFKDKGITNPNPVIYATISDASGINTVGNGIGHDITGVIDGKVSEPIILNDFFETDLDDYSRGKLSYPMFDLS